MSALISAVDVMGVLYRYSRMHDAPQDLTAVRSAVRELIDATQRTVRAFEALGASKGVLSDAQRHQACEAALVAQKAALARVTGSTPALTEAQQAREAQERG